MARAVVVLEVEIAANAPGAPLARAAAAGAELLTVTPPRGVRLVTTHAAVDESAVEVLRVFARQDAEQAAGQPAT